MYVASVVIQLSLCCTADFKGSRELFRYTRLSTRVLK